MTLEKRIVHPKGISFIEAGVKALLHSAVFLSLSVLFLFGCTAGGDDDDGGNMVAGNPALVGTWQGIEVEGGTDTWTFVFSATKMEAETSGFEVYKGNYFTDDTVVPHRADFEIVESDMSEYVGEKSLVIYKIEGNTLTMAASEPGRGVRPTEFVRGSSYARVFELTKQ